MKLQNLTVIFMIIIHVITITFFYITTGSKARRYQALDDDTALITETQDTIIAVLNKFKTYNKITIYFKNELINLIWLS